MSKTVTSMFFPLKSDNQGQLNLRQFITIESGCRWGGMMRMAMMFEHLPTCSGWLLTEFKHELEKTHHLAAGFVLNINHTQLTVD